MKTKFPKTFQYFQHYKNKLMDLDKPKEERTTEKVDKTNFYRMRRARSVSQFENIKNYNSSSCIKKHICVGS